MPNHIKNRLTIITDPKRRQEIRVAIQREKRGLGMIDFGKQLYQDGEELGNYEYRYDKTEEFGGMTQC